MSTVNQWEYLYGLFCEYGLCFGTHAHLTHDGVYVAYAVIIVCGWDTLTVDSHWHVSLGHILGGDYVNYKSNKVCALGLTEHGDSDSGI